jgi:hypothetical protein
MLPSTALRKILACVVSAALLLTSGVSSSAYAQIPSIQKPAGLVPPSHLGYLADSFSGDKNRKVILIQDLHAHLDTQQKIAGLLKFYESKGLLKGPVAIEGASGVWDLSLWNRYPQEANRQELFDFLLKEAALTGPEYFALQTHRPKLLWGVDQEADYGSQRALFRQTRLTREVAVRQLESAQQSLQVISGRSFKGKLASWKKLSDQFDRGDLYGDVYLKKLILLGSRVRLPSEAVSLQKALSARTAEEAASLAVSDRFYSDLRKYSQAVGLSLVQTPEQTNLLNASYAVDLVKRLLSQQLTLEEIRQLSSRQEETARLAYTLIQGAGQSSWLTETSLLELIRASTDFYVAALVRDEPMVTNTVELLGESSTVILIAGGFHTLGITRELKEQRISYDVVTPQITADYTAEDHQRYADRLSGIPVLASAFLQRVSGAPSARKEIKSPQAHTLTALLKKKMQFDVSMHEHLPPFQTWRQFFARERAESRPLTETFEKKLGLTARTVIRDETGRFAIPANEKHPLLIALRDRERLLGSNASLFTERIDEIHLLTGSLPELPELMIERAFTVEDLGGALFIRQEKSPGHYAVWVYERSLDSLMPYLKGARSTLLSRALIADGILVHENTQGHSDRAVKTFVRRGVLSRVLGILPDWAYRGLQDVPVTHEDLMAYGATPEGVLEALQHGASIPYVERFKERAGLRGPVPSEGWTEPQRVALLNELLEKVASPSEAAFFTSTQQAIGGHVGLLTGYGLNEVDKQLMGLYYSATDPDVKSRLSTVRRMWFERGHELAEPSFAAGGPQISRPEEPASEKIKRLRVNLQRWHHWALSYGEAYKKDHPTADEDNLRQYGKTVADEINQAVFEPLFKAVDTIQNLLRDRQIDPDRVKLKLSRFDSDGKIDLDGRPARVGFLPMKGDPWQIGHIFIMLEAIAERRLDKIVIMVDNGDPDRKPDLSSLAIREPMTLELLKLLEPFVEYSPMAKEEEDLQNADGERSIFRLISFNRGLPVEWLYMVGSDHRHWIVPNKNMPDTTKKLQGYLQNPVDGYAGETLGVVYMERAGEEFKPGEIEQLRELSGIPEIEKIYQPMDTSSTRVRQNGHWWTVPYDIFTMAKMFDFWEVGKASRVDTPPILHSKRWIAVAMGVVGLVAALAAPMTLSFVPASGVLLWAIPQTFKLNSLAAKADGEFDLATDTVKADSVDQRMHDFLSHVLTQRIRSIPINESLVEVVVFPIAFWVAASFGAIGFLQGLLRPIFRRSRGISPLVEARARAMQEFLESGQTQLENFASLAPQAARRAGPVASQFFGYLFAVKDRQRQQAYARARALATSA